MKIKLRRIGLLLAVLLAFCPFAKAEEQDGGPEADQCLNVNVNATVRDGSEQPDLVISVSGMVGYLKPVTYSGDYSQDQVDGYVARLNDLRGQVNMDGCLSGKDPARLEHYSKTTRILAADGEELTRVANPRDALRPFTAEEKQERKYRETLKRRMGWVLSPFEVIGCLAAIVGVAGWLIFDWRRPVVRLLVSGVVLLVLVGVAYHLPESFWAGLLMG